MFPKAALTFLAIGVLSINALVVPVARAPEPEPELRQLEARTDPLATNEILLLRDMIRTREPQNWAEAIAEHYAVNKRIGETQEPEARDLVPLIAKQVARNMFYNRQDRSGDIASRADSDGLLASREREVIQIPRPWGRDLVNDIAARFA